MASPEPLLLTAQRVLDELRKHGLIPFPLVAYKVEYPHGPGAVRIRFYDSRIYGVEVNWQPGENFKDLFRAAVLMAVPKGPIK
jgi:hypothetical protein